VCVACVYVCVIFEKIFFRVCVHLYWCGRHRVFCFCFWYVLCVCVCVRCFVVEGAVFSISSSGICSVCVCVCVCVCMVF